VYEFFLAFRVYEFFADERVDDLIKELGYHLPWNDTVHEDGGNIFVRTRDLNEKKVIRPDELPEEVAKFCLKVGVQWSKIVLQRFPVRPLIVVQNPLPDEVTRKDCRGGLHYL